MSVFSQEKRSTISGNDIQKIGVSSKYRHTPR